VGRTADHRCRAVWGMNCLRLLEHWDRGFESHSWLVCQRPCDGLIPRPGRPTDCLRTKKLKWNKAFHGFLMLQSAGNRKEKETARKGLESHAHCATAKWSNMGAQLHSTVYLSAIRLHCSALVIVNGRCQCRIQLHVTASRKPTDITSGCSWRDFLFSQRTAGLTPIHIVPAFGTIHIAHDQN
jgi:hypothetical protein